MLVLRPEQLEVLRRVPLSAFTASALEMVQKHFPVDFRILGRDGAVAVVELGIERALAKDVTPASDVRRWIALMLALGSFFDDDPQFPWAAKASLDEIYAAASAYLRRVAGERGEIYRNRLLRMRRIAYDDLVAGTADQLLRRLHDVKFGEIGETVIARMIALAESKAAQHSLALHEGSRILLGLMFFLGSHCDRDPVYPWLGAWLAAGGGRDPRALHAHALRQMDRYFGADA
ncbi:MAG: hypothetical protein ACXW5U_18210 [Thermoanaerobaculia bacterium]